MKKFILLVSTVVISLAMNVAFAAAKIAVFDLQKVLKKTSQVKVANKKLRKQFLPAGKKLVAKRKALIGDIIQLRQTPLMFTATRNVLAQNLLKEQQKFRAMQIGFQKDVLIARNKKLNKILSRVRKVAKKIAQREGYDFILTKNNLAYFDTNADITNQVIRALKK